MPNSTRSPFNAKKGSPILQWFRANLKTPVTVLLFACFAIWSVEIKAATFVWTDVPGNTSLAGNWLGGISPNVISVAGDSLNLNNVLTAPRTVTLDGLVTAGTMNIGDTTTTNAFTLAAGTGGYLMLDVSSGSAAINKALGRMRMTLSPPASSSMTRWPSPMPLRLAA